MQTNRELYDKLNSWVNKFGGDRAFASRITEAPKKVQDLIRSDPRLMERFGFSSEKKGEGEDDVG